MLAMPKVLGFGCTKNELFVHPLGLKTPLTWENTVPEVGLELHSSPCKR
jgi:hypothetical protein